MKRIATTTAALLLSAHGAAAQTLPSPQFASPPQTDNSNAAATTAWVRGLGLTGSGGDVSGSTVLVPGSSVARTLAARAATVFNVLDYGAQPNGTTDLGVALNAIAGQLSSSSANVIYIPAGNYVLKTAVVFNGVAPIIQGQGFTAGPNATNSSGTWITISPATAAGFTALTFLNTNARGAQLRDVAFSETQPAPASGWAPSAYGPVLSVQNALGQVTVENVLMAGVTRGVYADNSGRLDIKKLDGQFFTSGVEIDDCLDIGHIGQLHAWSYATSSPYVISYQEANEKTLILHRVDGIFVDDLFSLGAYAAIDVVSNLPADGGTGNNPGTLTKGYFSNVYADFVTYGVLVGSNATGATAQFDNVTTQNNDQTAPGNTLPGGRGLLVSGSTVGLQITNWRSNITAGSAIDLEGSGANVLVGTLWANTFGTPGIGTPAVTNVNTGTNPGNGVQVNHSWLQGVSPLYLFAPSNGGQEQPLLTNAAGNDADSLRAYSVPTGGAPSLQAIGSDTSVDLALGAKSPTGSVRLEANGQTVARADDANSGTDDVLLRSGAGTMNLIAEGGDSNVDFYLTPKGSTGGVRFQPNGLVTLRTDNPNGGNADLLVRPGTGAINLVAESAGGASDVDIAGLGASNGVRLQANGTTSLRTDNINGVADDLLVRPGSGTMSLIAEGSDSNVNIVMVPKGSGTVVVPTMPSTDHSTNAASTAFVAAVAPTLAPVQSVAGRQGAVTLGVADVSGAAPLAGAALTGTTSVSTQSGGRFTITGTQPGGSGFANSGTYMMVAKTTAATATRFTTDGNAPGSANCINPPANSADNLFVEVVGLDLTNAGAVARYRALDVLLYRGATAASTQVVNGATNAAPNGSVGSGSTAAFTVAADSTNGCLALSVTAPNADTWHWAARVRSTEVQ